MSPPEVALWQALKGRDLRGLKFRRQHPVEPYVLDFYCAEAKLAIEIDGAAHESRQAQDDRRDRYLLDKGIQTVRIPARAVFENIEGVLEQIAQSAGR